MVNSLAFTSIIGLTVLLYSRSLAVPRSCLSDSVWSLYLLIWSHSLHGRCRACVPPRHAICYPDTTLSDSAKILQQSYDCRQWCQGESHPLHAHFHGSASCIANPHTLLPFGCYYLVFASEICHPHPAVARHFVGHLSEPLYKPNSSCRDMLSRLQADPSVSQPLACFQCLSSVRIFPMSTMSTMGAIFIAPLQEVQTDCRPVMAAEYCIRVPCGLLCTAHHVTQSLHPFFSFYPHLFGIISHDFV